MDDMARAPLSQFSRYRADLRDKLVELRAGTASASTLATLTDAAELAGEEAVLCEIFSDQLGSEELHALPHATRLEMLLHIASFARNVDDADACALSAATHVLDLEPANEQALALAEPSWLEADAFGELANRYGVAATCASSDVRARALLEHAIKQLQGIPAAMPALVGLTERLSRLSTLREAEAPLLVALRAAGPGAPAALLKLGERWLAEGRAKEGAEQVPADLAAFQSEAALDMLERLFDQAEDFARLEQVLAARVESASSAAARGRALEKLATFLREQVGNDAGATGALLAAAQAYVAGSEPEDAERAYEQLLDIVPDHLNAASRLVTLRARAGNFAGVAEAFGVVMRAEADAAQACELLLAIAPDAQLAGAAEEFAELSDSVLWRLSSDEQELSARLLRQSAQLFAVQDRLDDAAELYRRLIADRAAGEDVTAFSDLIDAHPGSEWRRQQRRWLFEWQEHHGRDRPQVLLAWARFEEEELGDPAAAMSVLSRAAELWPDRPEIWDNLLRLRLAAGDGAGGLAAANELRRLGRDVDAAWLGTLLDHDPGARWAVDRVKLSLSAEERWPELFELYERAALASATDPERARWLDEAAIAARDVAQDRLRAIGYWQQYLQLVPGDARVDLALERLYEQSGNRAALIAHWHERLGRLDGAPRQAQEQRITALCLEHGDLAGALASIERQEESSDAQLEALLARSAQLWSEPQSRQAGQKAAEILRYRYSERPREVERILRELLLRELDHAERCQLLWDLSSCCDSPTSTFQVLRDLFTLTLAEPERESLERLAQELGAWQELCDTYASAADSELAPDERRALWRRAADIAQTQLRDASLTARCYDSLLAVEPERAIDVFEQGSDTDAAFDALSRLLTSSRRFAELASVLERRAESHSSPALSSRLGRLYADELNDAATAISWHVDAGDARAAGEVFLRQSSVFRDDAEAALELARELSSAGLPEGAARVLRHQLAAYDAQHPPERKQVHLALVQALEESGASDAAHAELLDAGRRYPTDADVQRACAATAAMREDWDRAEQCYRSLLLLLHGGEQTRAPIYVELAVIKQHRGAPSAATELIDSAFEAAVDSPEELQALSQSLVEHELWQGAERAASELLRQATDPTVALCTVAELRRRGHNVASELLSRAEQCATKAVKSGPSSALVRAAMTLVPLPAAQQLLQATKPQLSDGDALCARAELARRLLDEGDEKERAAAAAELRALVTHADAPTQAFEQLANVWEQSGDKEQLRALLDAWLDRAPNDAKLLRRALTLALSCADVERAWSLHERLARGGNAEQTLELAQLCQRSGKTSQAVRLWRQEAERETKPVKRATFLLHAAELLQELGDAIEAQLLASRAHELDPASAEAVWLLAKLAVAAKNPDEALGLLQSYADCKERRRGKGLARVLRLAADLHLERDALAEALPLLTEAHQLDKTDLDTALLLGLLAIDLDRLETAAAALRVLLAQREANGRGDAERSTLLAQGYFQLARIEQHHGKKLNAKRMAQRALEENPNLAPAQRLLNELGPH